jgi:hypothetical protein
MSTVEGIKTQATVDTSDTSWTRWHTLGLFGTLAAIALFGLLMPVEKILLIWLLIMGALALFSMIAGHGITGQFWFGWLIDEQNKMSLSRLQMFLWTIVVLSAFLTAALVNIKNGYINSALDIAIPEQIWLAMGISTISLVSSPLILSGKKKEEPNEKTMGKMLVQRKLLAPNATETDKARVEESHSIGKLYRNKAPSDARLYDLVRGEETSNAAVLDLSRLQNLFFTLILLGAYAANLGGYLANHAATKSALDQFPALSASAIALLAISHAGYLGSKAIGKQ